MTVQVRNSST